MKLKKMSQIPGCLLAVVIDNEGNCLAFQSGEELHAESVPKTAEAMAAVTSALEKLSVELEILTGRSCLPQEGWVYMGSGVTAIMGGGGFRGIVLENLDSVQMECIKKCFALVDDSEVNDTEVTDESTEKKAGH